MKKENVKELIRCLPNELEMYETDNAIEVEQCNDDMKVLVKFEEVE